MRIEGSARRFSTWEQIFVLTLIVSCLFPCSAVMAEPVRLERARQVADTFLRTRTARILRGTRELLKTETTGVHTPAGFREILSDDGAVLAYVADLKPRGFVAVSADTDIVPIIAYSLRSPFPSNGDRDNPLYRLLTEDMKLRTKALAERDRHTKSDHNDLWSTYVREDKGQPVGSGFQQWPPENTTSTGGWLETAWHQDLPYNDFCPLDPVDGLRSYVGCVATAMAQIVNYHRQCNLHFDGSDSYTIASGINIDGDSVLYDFPSFAELNGYLSVIGSKYAGGFELDYTDAAALSFACGITSSMDYTSEGSGAYSYDAQRGLLEKFGFYSADMTGGMSAESFQLLRENMINGLPVYIAIAPSDGWGGHIVVCDGYNTDGQYHLNFGWGAPYPEPITEVWYHLPGDLLDELSIVTEAILNIQPFQPQINVDPVSLSFYAAPGQESESKTLHIESGPGGLSISAISSPEGFVLAYPGESYSDHLGAVELKEPGSHTTLRVKFRPDQAGGFYGTLTISYNNGNTKYVALKGSSFSGGTQISAGQVAGTWSQAESPYFIDGDVAVRKNSELIIESGVRVVFVGPYSMTIGENARLAALGNQNGSIEFTACNRDIGWGGLRFVDSGEDDVLSYCSVSYAKRQAELIATPPDTQTTDEGTAVFGAAIHCSSSSPTITSCRIANNESGAIHFVGSNARITNTVIANNSTIGGDTQCGGIFSNEQGRPQIKNCTIVNNSPGGIFTQSADGIEVMNTILWGNDRYQIQTYESTATVSFCDVEDGFSGQGNINADPSFLAASPGTGSGYDGLAANWALRSSSPCINAARQTDLPETDLAGNPRVSSYLVDIGAYENQSELPLITIAPSATLDAGFAYLDTSSMVGIEIVNTGDLALEVKRLSIIDPNGVFSTATQMNNRLLAPGEAIEAQIVFSPAEEKVYKGALIVHSTCSNGPQKRVSLRGVGISGTRVAAGAVSGLWTKAGSPYTITGDIHISEGRTLTIEPGVVVKFAGHFKFTIGYRATLHAVGTDQENIILTPTDPNEGWFGIRFVNSGTDDVLEYCTIEYAKKNRSGAGGFYNQMGGAIICYSSSEPEDGRYRQSSPTIRNCVIAHNEAQLGAGIMVTDDSEAVIVNNRIVDNSADAGGGGIYVIFAQGTIANNVIAHNWSGVVGGGILNYLATPRIMNNTIVHNRPSALHLETITLSSTVWESALVLNNIIWENEIYMSEEVWPDEYDIRFNDIQGGDSGSGNIDVDPLFADSKNRDYHLVSEAGRWDPDSESWVRDSLTSPCIDAGDPDGPIGDELMPHGNRINMGAYGGTWQASKSQD